MMERRILLQLFGCALGIATAPRALAQSRSVQLIIIVGRASPLRNIELGDLRRSFSGDPVAEPGGSKLIPLNHPPKTPDRVAFDQMVLGMSPENVANFWIDRKIRGQSGPPRTVSSLSILLGVVSRLPGAIGYVRPQYVTAEVRALNVAGKSPGSPGYPLVYIE